MTALGSLGPVSAVAQRVLDALGGLQGAYARAAGELLPDVVDALTEPLVDLDTRTAATPADVPESWYPWAQVFDLDHTPDPAWLGAAIGSPVPPAITDPDEQRAYVRTRPQWRRGTPDAIRAAVAAVIPGATPADVGLVERSGHGLGTGPLRAWHLALLISHPDLDPDLDGDGAVPDDVILAAAYSAAPVGIVISFYPGVSYAHLTAEHGTYADLLDDLPTYADSITHEPEEGTIP